MTKYNIELFRCTQSDLSDTRIKFIKGQAVEILQSQYPIFNPLGLKRYKKDRYLEKNSKNNDENVENIDKNVENVDAQYYVNNSALRRARRNVYDLCACNDDLEYFITLTLDKELIDRYDYSIIIKKLNTWLDNAVRRKGLKYVLVPEQHKDGAYHFHGLINDCFKLIDSGKTVNSCDEVKPIYNIPEWKYGFTTAIHISGNRDNVCKYITKYITKQSNIKKIAGRYYYHGGALVLPEYFYYNSYYEDLTAENVIKSYEFSPDGVNNTFRCYKLKGDDNA